MPTLQNLPYGSKDELNEASILYKDHAQYLSFNITMVNNIT